MSVFSDVVQPIVIFETESKYNGKIVVSEKGKTRKLLADNTLQSVNFDSPIVSRMSWGKIVSVIEESLGSVGRVLLLGLGGGTIPKLLNVKFPGIYIVSVDIDPVIVDVGRKYFGIDEIPNHRIIIDDACRVVTSPEEYGFSPAEFDVVIVNIFNGETYPELGNSGGFFYGIKNLIRPNGLAVFNRIYLKHHQDDVNIFIDNVSACYRDVKSAIVAGYTNSDNVVIYGFV